MQDTDKEEWAGGVAWLHIGIEVQGPAEGGGEEYCAHSNLYDDKLKLKFYSYSQAGLVVPCPGTGHH